MIPRSGVFLLLQFCVGHIIYILLDKHALDVVVGPRLPRVLPQGPSPNQYVGSN